MITILAFVIIVLFSFFLAFRSMRSFQDVPYASLSYSLYLIPTKAELTPEILKKIHAVSLELDSIFSIELLKKGDEEALVLYAPLNLIKSLPEIDMIELEDYLDDIETENPQIHSKSNIVNINLTLVWVVESGKLTESANRFLDNINLTDAERFFLQIVCHPVKSGSEYPEFQVTLRCMAVSGDPSRRVGLTKQIETLMDQTFGLKRDESQSNSKLTFTSFKRRALIPKEVQRFVLSGPDLIRLMNS